MNSLQKTINGVIIVLAALTAIPAYFGTPGQVSTMFVVITTFALGGAIASNVALAFHEGFTERKDHDGTA